MLLICASWQVGSSGLWHMKPCNSKADMPGYVVEWLFFHDVSCIWNTSLGQVNKVRNLTSIGLVGLSNKAPKSERVVLTAGGL